MPLSREEFDQRRIDLSLPVGDLLETYPDLAFTAEEVREMLMQRGGRQVTLGEVELALENLVSIGQVETAEFAGQRWYTIVVPEQRRLGFPGERR